MFDSCLMAIQFAQSTKKNILAVSLDAEKAFYQVQRGSTFLMFSTVLGWALVSLRGLNFYVGLQLLELCLTFPLK